METSFMFKELNDVTSIQYNANKQHINYGLIYTNVANFF